jgi:hypothetical protein
MEGILGPLEQSIVFDEFTYDEVKKGECLGQAMMLSKRLY